MTKQTHSIEVYEPYDYDGDNPLPVEALGIVRGPGNSQYYLIRTTSKNGQHQANTLVIAPRYEGDLISQVVTSQCTVSVSRLQNGTQLQPGDTLTFADIVYWGVGKIMPVSH